MEEDCDLPSNAANSMTRARKTALTNAFFMIGPLLWRGNCISASGENPVANSGEGNGALPPGLPFVKICRKVRRSLFSPPLFPDTPHRVRFVLQSRFTSPLESI